MTVKLTTRKNETRIKQHQGEIKLGPPLVGEPWPDLEVHIETGQDPVTGTEHVGIRASFSNRTLCILAFIATLLYASITHDSAIVNKIVLLAKALLK